MAFSLISSSDRTKLLKSGLNNQRKDVEYYINRGKLVYKCFTCNQIDHLNKINGQTKKASPAHRQCIAELQKKKLGHLEQMLSMTLNN